MTCLSIVNISLGIWYYHVFEDLHSYLSLKFLCTAPLNLFLYVGSLFLLLWSENKTTVLRSCTFYYKRDFSAIWISVNILLRCLSIALFLWHSSPCFLPPRVLKYQSLLLPSWYVRIFVINVIQVFFSCFPASHLEQCLLSAFFSVRAYLL